MNLVTDDTRLAVEKISVQFNQNWLLRDISLALKPGQLLALIGPNGAGKSTLLKVLSGNITPTQGTIVLNGRPLHHWSLQQQARIRAVLPQYSPLTFPLSVFEVVSMGRSPHTSHKQINQEVVHNLLAQMELTHLTHRHYTTLSGGEKQRVHLARVLTQIWYPTDSHQPRYLLLDEPTANLDIAHQHNVLQLLRHLTKQSVGILLIIHDINLAAIYAHQVACLKAGSLIAIGSPQHILTTSLIQEVFQVTTKIMMIENNPVVVTLPTL